MPTFELKRLAASKEIEKEIDQRQKIKVNRLFEFNTNLIIDNYL